jgi:phosphotransferase system HPr-like phosphotransfer protein
MSTYTINKKVKVGLNNGFHFRTISHLIKICKENNISLQIDNGLKKECITHSLKILLMTIKQYDEIQVELQGSDLDSLNETWIRVDEYLKGEEALA